jgi:hypothetical protein
VYILDEKVRPAKRHTSSHGNGQLFGALHVTVQQMDTTVISEQYLGTR